MKVLVFVALFGFVSIFCQSDPNTVITVEQLKQRLSNGDSNLVVLDVRTPDELKGELGEIKDAINIPLQVLEEKLATLENVKDKEIAVVCRSGARSARATSILLNAGFKAKNVSGGMLEYNRK